MTGAGRDGPAAGPGDTCCCCCCCCWACLARTSALHCSRNDSSSGFDTAGSMVLMMVRVKSQGENGRKCWVGSKFHVLLLRCFYGCWPPAPNWMHQLISSATRCPDCDTAPHHDADKSSRHGTPGRVPTLSPFATSTANQTVLDLQAAVSLLRGAHRQRLFCCHDVTVHQGSCHYCLQSTLDFDFHPLYASRLCAIIISNCHTTTTK
jgi:hypothetical protein